jgi:hypothetical protein
MAIELAEFGRTGHRSSRVIFGGAAVQTIKSIARRPWLGRVHTQATWYEASRFAGPPDDAATTDLMRRSAVEPLFV